MMDKIMASKILGHQLKGIMLHSDLYKAYLFNKDKKHAMRHYKQCLAETKTFMQTTAHLIDTLGCMIEPLKEQQVVVPSDATHEQMCEMWRKWELNTVALYCDILKTDDCPYFKKLLSETRKELTTS